MRRFVLILAIIAAVVLVVMVIVAIVDAGRYPVATLRSSVPPRTALMKQRIAEAKKTGRRYSIDQRWISYGRISPLLRRAILIAEDDAFYQHGGLDWNEIQAAAKKNLEKRRVVRGGSTITQQLAKNLYLGDRRTLLRKFQEVPLAMRIEGTLTKRRIFELYLNEIEWGDGIFGCEAAAQRYFGVSCAQLDARQAVLLAAVIINPRRFSVIEPPRRIEKRARMIASRLKRRGFLTEEQYAVALGQPPPAKQSLMDLLFGVERGPEPQSPDSAASPVIDETPVEVDSSGDYADTSAVLP